MDDHVAHHLRRPPRAAIMPDQLHTTTAFSTPGRKEKVHAACRRVRRRLFFQRRLLSVFQMRILGHSSFSRSVVVAEPKLLAQICVCHAMPPRDGGGQGNERHDMDQGG